MNDITSLRRAALSLVSQIKASTGQLGALLDGLIRKRQFNECCTALARRATDPSETDERREEARLALDAVCAAAFGPGTASA